MFSEGPSGGSLSPRSRSRVATGTTTGDISAAQRPGRGRTEGPVLHHYGDRGRRDGERGPGGHGDRGRRAWTRATAGQGEGTEGAQEEGRQARQAAQEAREHARSRRRGARQPLRL